MKSQPKLTTPAGSDQGFTLLELIIGMAISALVMTAIYATFRNQHETHILQGLVVSAQQNLRAGMLFMEREIRMAGCDPLGSAGAEINTANADSISFTLDYTGGGVGGAFPNGVSTDANENIKYEYELEPGNLTGNLMRTSTLNGTPQMIAENIGALDFVYLDDKLAPLNPGRTDITDAIDIAKIRSVQITMVAVADRGLPGYFYTRTYSNQQGDVIYVPVNNNINSRAMTVTIKARNLGL